MERHVTLTGYRSGAYEVVEERPDGSLVVTPATTGRGEADAGTHRWTRRSSGALARLMVRAPSTQSVPEILEGWGVQLAWDEEVVEFQRVDVDGQSGFVAVTNQRFVFKELDRAAGSPTQHPLPAATVVEPARRGRRRELRVTWESAESVIALDDGDALERLRAALQGRGGPP